MSFFGLGQRQPTSEEKIAMMESEISSMMDLQSRLTRICSKKCVPGDYREGELNKGESVCLDRCSSKFFEAWMKTSDVMMKFSEQMGTGAAGGTGGFPKMD